MKLPWYMESNKKGTEIKFHWLWCVYQKLKTFIKNPKRD